MEEIRNVLRKEKKYLISTICAENLYIKLKSLLQEDLHSNSKRGYQVRSLYFDTLDDTDYEDKEAGYEERRKIRLRIYSPEAQTAKLELKEKSGDDQRKRSFSVSREHAIEMAEGNYEGLLTYDNPFTNKLYFMMNQQVYRPKCMVEYKRSAFYTVENDIRITLDSEVKASEGNFDLFSLELNLYPVSHFEDVILEVKYNHFLLSYIKDLLELSNKVQSSNSKYCMARKSF